MPLQNSRSFPKLSAFAGAFSTNSLFHKADVTRWQAAARALSHMDVKAVAQDEDYWSVIQRGFSVSPLIMNLNHGGVSPRRLWCRRRLRATTI